MAAARVEPPSSVSFFPDFQLSGKQKIFKKLPENPENSQDSRYSGNFRKISRDFFPSLIVLPFFLVFSTSDLIFSILLRCFDKLSFSFSIFLIN